MIMNKEFSKAMFEYIDKTKQISRLGFEAKEFDAYINTLNLISALDYDINQFEGYDIDKYLIPHSFSQLVIPRKIGYDTGVEYLNLRSDDYVNYNAVKAGFTAKVGYLKPREFNMITSAIFSSRRLTKSDDTVNNLAELNGETTLDKVVTRIHHDNKPYGPSSERFVASNANPYIPIDFKFNVLRSNMITNRLDNMLDDWMEIALGNLSNKKSE